MLTKRLWANNIRKMPAAVSQVTAQMALLRRFQQFQPRTLGVRCSRQLFEFQANPWKSENMETGLSRQMLNYSARPCGKTERGLRKNELEESY